MVSLSKNNRLKLRFRLRQLFIQLLNYNDFKSRYIGQSYVLEGSSDAYVVLFDTKQTFNKVWHEGLFYQLFKYKIDYKLWCILRNYYTGFKCSVEIRGIQSFWFDIKQEWGVFELLISGIH